MVLADSTSPSPGRNAWLNSCAGWSDASLRGPNCDGGHSTRIRATARAANVGRTGPARRWRSFLPGSTSPANGVATSFDTALSGLLASKEPACWFHNDCPCPPLLRRRLIYMVDDQDVHAFLSRFHSQSKLVLNRRPQIVFGFVRVRC